MTKMIWTLRAGVKNSNFSGTKLLKFEVTLKSLYLTPKHHKPCKLNPEQAGHWSASADRLLACCWGH